MNQPDPPTRPVAPSRIQGPARTLDVGFATTNRNATHVARQSVVPVDRLSQYARLLAVLLERRAQEHVARAEGHEGNQRGR